MDLGLLFIPDKKIPKITMLSEIAEKSGFKYIWVADENFYRDVYITLTSIAIATSKIFLGPGCTNPYTRHPAMTALAMATLNELSKGRAVFAIGSGGINLLDPLNLTAKKPLSAIEDFIKVFKKIVAGEKATLISESFSMKNVRLAFTPSGEIPVYIACRGPKMLKLAGKVAEGVLLGSVPLEYIKVAKEFIEEGKSLVGRDSGKFEIANSIIFSASSDREKAFDLAKPYLIYSLAATPEYILKVVGFSQNDIKPIIKALPDEKKASEEITKEIVEKFAIAGTIDECIDKIKAYANVGVTQLVCSSPIGEDEKEIIESLGKKFLRETKDYYA
ncbi:MAG: LLM class flavin-dependent oxidoreductase [Candidatus Bathyarchaeia archaeon]